MSWFPQIGSGSIAQFPVTRGRQWRSIVNIIESGEQVTLPDSGGDLIQWHLSYQELTASEVANLNALFQASQGQFAPFTFVDPLANLLGWSEDLSQPGWQLGVLQATAGANDPLGTQRASTIVNGSGGNQASLPVGEHFRLDGRVLQCLGSQRRRHPDYAGARHRPGGAAVTPVWTRVYLSGLGSSGAGNSTFGLGVAAGQTIEVWGLQVEAQPYPSKYMSTTTAYGIYGETYFASDQLTITASAPGLSACEIQLVSRG